MGVPQLTTCCFVFDLKTGTTIMGVVNAVLSFIMLVTMIVTASSFGELQNSQVVELDPDVEAEAHGLYVISILLVLMYVAKFFLDLLFIYGVVKEQAGVIKFYGIAWAVVFLLSSFMFFLHVLDFHPFTIITALFLKGLNIYAALLVYNFYLQINKREGL